MVHNLVHKFQMIQVINRIPRNYYFSENQSAHPRMVNVAILKLNLTHIYTPRSCVFKWLAFFSKLMVTTPERKKQQNLKLTWLASHVLYLVWISNGLLKGYSIYWSETKWRCTYRFKDNARPLAMIH
jgi:hypothetical protein